MAKIEEYLVHVPDAKIERLKQKLAVADFPDELEDVGWDRGSPLLDIKRLAVYWQDTFDWRKAEAKLNELPQFTTDIKVDGWETLKIHFVHQKSKVEGAIPLLFVHGWPGSFYEVSRILPELVQGTRFYPAFHVVAPSLPNFGFSEGVKKKGWTSREHAETCHKLMLALGYPQYVTQGGDIGTSVTRGCGYLHPEACKASHLNMAIPNPPTVTGHFNTFFRHNQTPLSDSDRAGIRRTEWFRKEGYGYNLEQSTKPQTIGYSMTDSPIGLLSWIYEKLHDWTDAYPWTDEEVLTWVSIYWFSTAGPAASQRLYYESTHDSTQFATKIREYIPDVKLGIARFPKELFLMPKLWHETMGPLVLQSEYDEGGHFAAWERPDAIVRDLREMFGKKGGAHGVVKGRSGFD